MGEEKWVAATTGLTRILNWPFQGGRTPYTVLFLTLVGMLVVSITARRGWRFNPVRTIAWGLRAILPLLGERAGVRAKAFLDSLYFKDLLRRHDDIPEPRFRLRGVSSWQQLLSAFLIPVLILATTPTISVPPTS